MKINRIIYSVRVSDAIDVGSKVYELLKNYSPEDVHLTAIENELDAVLKRLSNALNEIKAESEMDLFDTKRDNTYRSIMYLNRGYLLYPDVLIKEAALEVEQVFKQYGFELIRANYSAQTALTDAFIRDIKETAIAEKMALLPGMTNLVTRLEDDQVLFKKAEKKWHDAKNDNAAKENATELKHNLVKIINSKLVTYLRAMMHLRPDSYKGLSLSIASHINQINALIKRRQLNLESNE